MIDGFSLLLVGIRSTLGSVIFTKWNGSMWSTASLLRSKGLFVNAEKRGLDVRSISLNPSVSVQFPQLHQLHLRKEHAETSQPVHCGKASAFITSPRRLWTWPQTWCFSETDQVRSPSGGERHQSIESDRGDQSPRTTRCQRHLGAFEQFAGKNTQITTSTANTSH